ncbi:hypothetical protein HD_1730 [[Haemophilus] ducreyi 35000HP]|uniref:Uncharacterized protein n=1 Tax=Haemophilus ducreyi (strain 35000HP / ATCC 700724) TaxID=233412 RepID=Q7VKY1_HAEDU|nr:hypothetical protein HD_1730 [[Haemophilus] ducreyi 35000HP]
MKKSVKKKNEFTNYGRNHIIFLLLFMIRLG